MLTLYSYPELFGVADNNGYGLKVFAFLRLAGVPFRHEHIFDASSAPRGQLPTPPMTEGRAATVTPPSPPSPLRTSSRSARHQPARNPIPTLSSPARYTTPSQ